jgi:tRNA A37 methylthiotransferase MiaB
MSRSRFNSLGNNFIKFVFILLLMKETMQITNHLYMALQSKSQDILNAIHLVSSSKACIQQYRDDK